MGKPKPKDRKFNFKINTMVESSSKVTHKNTKGIINLLSPQTQKKLEKETINTSPPTSFKTRTSKKPKRL